MRLTTRGRFAVTAMVYLALRQTCAPRPVTLAEISSQQRISLAYLEQLFAKLRRRRIVRSVRGPGGGYVLARQAQIITVADIIIAVDEPLDATRCGGEGGCEGARDRESYCTTHRLWSMLNQKMIEFLTSVSLAQLVQQQYVSEHPLLSSVSALGAEL